MNTKNFSLIICIIFLLLIISTNSNAQDVKLKIPKTSIDNMMNAFTKAKYFSYGATDLGNLVEYYSLRPQSASVTIAPGNTFTINFIADFTADMNFTIFDFDYVKNGFNVTVTGVIQLHTLESGYKIIFVPQSVSSSGGSTVSSVINAAGSGLIAKLPELSININQPLLPVIIGQYFTSNTPTLSSSSNGIELSLTLKTGPRYITALNDVNQQINIGSIQNEEGTNNFVSYPSPKTFEWNTGTTHKLQTPLILLDASNGKNKYRNWLAQQNPGSPLSEIAPRRIQITVGQLDETYKAKFDFAKRVQLSNRLEGSLSGGTVTYKSTTVPTFDDYDFQSSTIQQPINTNVPNGTLGKNWIFQSWSDGNTNKSRNIIVNNDINLTANYKGIQVSNDATAFSNNGQRKLIQTEAGGTIWLHQVYSSLDHVWIEHSSNGGQTWVLGNNGKPLDGTAGGKNPSIAYAYGDQSYDWNYIGVVWQQKNGEVTDPYKIYGKMFSQYAGSSGIPGYGTVARLLYPIPSDVNTEPYTTNANPNLVLSQGHLPYYFLCFEKKTTNGSWQAGINWIVGQIESGSGQTAGPFSYNEITSKMYGVISGTNASTTNVQLSLYPGYVGLSINLIRQQGSPGKIYSNYIGMNPCGWECWQPPTQVSDGMISYNANVNSSPSIVSLPTYDYASCWVEYTSMAFKTYNQTRSYYGSGVRSSSINRGGSSSLNSGFAVWSQNPSTWSNKSIRFVNGSPVSASISTLNTSGNYVQVGNGAGTDLTNMFVSSFYPFSSPYYFITSAALPLSKENGEIITGRGFEINLEDAAFSYRFDDLNVDGKNISFVDAPDELDYGKAETVNNVLLTEPFQINANSKIIFSERSGFIDTLAAVRNLGKDGFIKFKLDLIDEATGEVLAPVKSVSLNSANAYAERKPAYQLNAKGFAGKIVRIKISMESNLIEYTSPQLASGDTTNLPDFLRKRLNKRISNLYLTKSFKEVNETVNKAEFNNLEVIEVDIPTTYAMEQNYPNPFNPSTTIKYQIPEAGFVTIKIYDVLGKEVKTLINEEKNIGRYEIKFDASGLASGMYIYQLKVNSFTASKKMLLVK